MLATERFENKDCFVFWGGLNNLYVHHAPFNNGRLSRVISFPEQVWACVWSIATSALRPPLNPGSSTGVHNPYRVHRVTEVRPQNYCFISVYFFKHLSVQKTHNIDDPSPLPTCLHIEL